MVTTTKMWNDVADALAATEPKAPTTPPLYRYNYAYEQYEEVANWWEQDFPLAPRKFQLTGIRRMMRRKRYINRDKPGLGKTLQAAYAAQGPTLVVCPNYLTEQWRDWLRGVKRGPNKHPAYAPYGRQRVVWCKGNFNQKLTSLQREDADYWIINQESFSTHADEIKAMAKAGKWQTLILDEAHHFRNKDSNRAKTAFEVSLDCEFVYLLTGTLIWKEIDDLYMPFKICKPSMFPSYYTFVDNFCIADTGRFGTKVMGAKREMIPELDKLINLMSIGRSYEEAGRELPPVITKYIDVEFPPAVKKAYMEMCATFRMQIMGEDIRFDNFSQIMRAMRLMTAFPGKYEAVKNIIEDEHDEEHGTLVFTWYKETCVALADYIGGVWIDGDIHDPAERRRLALSNKKIVANISSLSEGIDLSHFRLVIFAEEHYAPGAIEQAMDRVIRERQQASNKDPVSLFYVNVKDSIDTVIHAKVHTRGATAKEILSEALHI